MIAPVVVLIGFGLWFVLQERQLARQDAVTALQLEGRKLITQLEDEIPLLQWIQNPSTLAEMGPNELPKDALLISLSATGECLNPEIPIQPRLPTPTRLPWHRLSESLILAWEEVHRTTNAFRRIKLAHDFLVREPPLPFSTLMTLTKISALVEVSRFSTARDAIQQLWEKLPENIHSEAGIAVPVLLDLLEARMINQHILDGDDPHKALLRFGERQLAKPSDWSNRLLSERIIPSSSSPRCTQLQSLFVATLARHREARSIHQSLPASEWQRWIQSKSQEPKWVQKEQDHFLIQQVTDKGSEHQFVAVSETYLKETCQKTVDARAKETPVLFSLSMSGRLLASSKLLQEEAPNRDRKEPFDSLQSSSPYPWLQTRATMADPDRYFERSRRRTRSVLFIIALASMTGIAGWALHLVALRRQIALGKMKSNFVASVSHELRAPVASIQLMSENLQSQEQMDSQKQHNYLDWIKLECARLSALVDNVLQFSHLETGKSTLTLEPVDIQNLYEGTMRLMNPIAINAHRILEPSPPNTDLPNTTSWPSGLWDGQAVHQALVNLIDNAIKHTPQGGTIRVGVKVFAKQRLAEFTVRDEGSGIPETERERIFLPFERLGSEETRRTKGVGIGLSLVKHTAEAHGGSITLESPQSGGSCFVLSLPLEPAPS